MSETYKSLRGQFRGGWKVKVLITSSVTKIYVPLETK